MASYSESDQPVMPGLGVSLDEKVETAIKTVRYYADIALAASPDGYFGCFSGGKDSCVLKHVVGRAGVPVKWWYSLTTVDPPELVRFIRDRHPDVQWKRPPIHMWTKTEQWGLPYRTGRWCCRDYKETSGEGLVKLTGVRAAESSRRAKLWSVLSRWREGGYLVNPILYWTDVDVWQYIRSEGVPYCSLYDEGFHRLGCVGCPMASARITASQFARWPRYRDGWLRAARRYWASKVGNSDSRIFSSFTDADEWFRWWESREPMPGDPEDDGQLCLGLYDGDDTEA